MSDWFTGSGEQISFEDILDLVLDHGEDGGTVYIGTDSMIKKKKCIFCTAICLHGDARHSNRYFFKKIETHSKDYEVLFQRIMTEVQNSVDIGLKLLYYYPDMNIELHLDISKSGGNTKTSKMADMLVGYAKGSGFECRTKPLAFAASSVADKHSK
jgi:predicted RNase H-related nuclease YkuK (DUF458 family)|tara:strand:- start:5699 stop:6166 length:468 start_codon:yes stop_codon:yes gene_type:complete